MVNKQKIGAFIASLRKEKNLTQAELAERLNVSNKSISRWENGQTLPDYDQVLDLCAILEIDVAEFLAGESQSDMPAPVQPEPEPEPAEPEPKKQPNRRRTAVLSILAASALLVAGILIAVAVRAGSTRTAIDAAHFPDEAFLRFVDRAVEHRHSGSFTQEELLAVTELDCSGKNFRCNRHRAVPEPGPARLFAEYDRVAQFVRQRRLADAELRRKRTGCAQSVGLPSARIG